MTPSGRGRRPPADAESTKASSDDRAPDQRDRYDLGAVSQTRIIPGILPCALRASPWLFQIAPGDLVDIDVTTCIQRGGAVRIVASVEESTTIRAILDHFAKHVALEEAHYRPAGHDTPKTKPGKEHDVATILQGVVRTAVGNRREIALRTALPKTH